jgi:hypothetical protein
MALDNLQILWYHSSSGKTQLLEPKDIQGLTINFTRNGRGTWQYQDLIGDIDGHSPKQDLNSGVVTVYDSCYKIKSTAIINENRRLKSRERKLTALL